VNESEFRAVLPGLEGYAKRDQTLGQWDTHPELARAFARWCGFAPGDRVLEPSAGIGNLVTALSELGADATAIEIDSERAEVLSRGGRARSVETANFLTLSPKWFPQPFDLVAMNPPYEADGETRHILHGLRFAPRVCAIMRLVGLSSASRSAAWRSVALTRVAQLAPRPAFAGSSGMDEIVFVEVRSKLHTDPPTSLVLMEWLAWREVAGSAP
jgi:predicted RNA methylase